jgi:hypothetical protein
MGVHNAKMVSNNTGFLVLAKGPTADKEVAATTATTRSIVAIHTTVEAQLYGAEGHGQPPTHESTTAASTEFEGFETMIVTRSDDDAAVYVETTLAEVEIEEK